MFHCYEQKVTMTIEKNVVRLNNKMEETLQAISLWVIESVITQVLFSQRKVLVRKGHNG